MYGFTEAIERVINDCKSKGSGEENIVNEDGRVVAVLKAEWVRCGNDCEVVEMGIYHPRGFLAYAVNIEETKKVTKFRKAV